MLQISPFSSDLSLSFHYALIGQANKSKAQCTRFKNRNFAASCRFREK